MVPILNHSLFINMNNRIINVIIEIVKAIGLLNTILSFDRIATFLISLLDLLRIDPVIPIDHSNTGFKLHSAL